MLAGLLLAIAGCTSARAQPRPDGSGPARPSAGERDDEEAPAHEGTRAAGRTDARLDKLVADLQASDQLVVYYAAVELLRARATGSAPPAVLAQLKLRLDGGSPEQRRTIINAIGRFVEVPDTPVSPQLVAELLPLLRPFLGHPEAEVRREAVQAVAALDRAVPEGSGLDVVGELLEQLLGRSAQLAEVLSAVRIIGRKPPKQAVPRLLDVLDRYSDRRHAEVQAAVYEELYQATGHRFRNRRDWRRWWEENKQRRPEDWYRERLLKAEQEAARARGAALKWWQQFLETVTDRDRQLAVLGESLGEDIPEIRAEAARRLVRLNRPEGYERLFVRLEETAKALEQARERPVAPEAPEVLQAMLEALAGQPPEGEELRLRGATLARKLLALHPDKEVRLRAVRLLGALQVSSSVGSLLELLRAQPLDVDMAEAALDALARVGGDGSPSAAEAVLALLEAERARPAEERQPRLVEAALKTLAALARRGQLPAETPVAASAVSLTARLLASDNGQGGAGPKVRQLAAAALRELKDPTALPALVRALADPDDDVVRFIVDAVSAIAAAPRTSAERRQEALQALLQAYEGGRPVLRDSVVDAVRAVTAAVPQAMESMAVLAARMREQAAEPADWARLVRLLRDLPEAPPAGAPEAVWARLRALLAEAHLRARPPDGRAAIKILEALAARGPAFRERLAEALLEAGTADELVRADRLFAELIAEGGDPAVLWPKRLRVSRRLLDLGASEPARKLIDAQLKASPPDSVREELLRLAQAAAVAPAPASGAGPSGGEASGGGRSAGEGERAGGARSAGAQPGGPPAAPAAPARTEAGGEPRSP
ncbi:MAG: hypothetical protein KatS3mg102_2788 [Planctomycetota bacterium]|nr:MAG: hypothetical protein KatS3mg102_2788 [Planctomycetota bacterium]